MKITKDLFSGDTNGYMQKKSTHFPSSSMRDNVPLYQNSMKENEETMKIPERSNKGDKMKLI